MFNPLVSVIIPAYNADKFITKALDSVFAQTYRPIEIIVIDDGSTDETVELVKNYKKNNLVPMAYANKEITQINCADINLICLYQENRGPSKARNTGIKAAKGEYIALLDADDLWTPAKLEKQMKYMITHPEISLVFGDMMVFEKERDLKESALKRNGQPECDEKGMVLNAFNKLLERNYISTGTVLLKKDCFKSLGYFDESIKYAEDYDLWLRISLMFEIGYIPEIFRLKRIHDSNISKNQIQFYFSRIYSLRKISKHNSDLLRSKAVSLNKYILKEIKELSYFYYLQKQYKNALKTGIKYFFNVLKSKIRNETI